MSDLTLTELLDSGTYVILPSGREDHTCIRITNYLLEVKDLDFGGSPPEDLRQEDRWLDGRLDILIPIHGKALMFSLMSVEIFVPAFGQHVRIRSPQKLDQLKVDIAHQIESTVRRRLTLTGGKPVLRSQQEELSNQLLLETGDEEVDETLRVAVDAFLKKNRGRFESSVLRGIFMIKALRQFDAQEPPQ